MTSASTSAQVSLHEANVLAQILLSTASIVIIDGQNNPQIDRALLHSGSQFNFISEKFATKLGLERVKTTICVTGINNSSSTVTESTRLR